MVEHNTDDNHLIDHSFRGSSFIASASYDRRSQEMTVFLQNGKSYDMTGVPPDMFDNFCKAGSPGKYFNQYLKGQY